jgi:hypothetical protein
VARIRAQEERQAPMYLTPVGVLGATSILTPSLPSPLPFTSCMAKMLLTETTPYMRGRGKFLQLEGEGRQHWQERKHKQERTQNTLFFLRQKSEKAANIGRSRQLHTSPGRGGGQQPTAPTQPSRGLKPSSYQHAPRHHLTSTTLVRGNEHMCSQAATSCTLK